MIKGLLIKEATERVQIINTNGLDDYYKIIKCSYIDIQEYEVGGKNYIFIFDGEFFDTGKTYTTVIDTEGKTLIAGDVYICGLPDDKGTYSSLTNDDIRNIENNIMVVEFENKKTGSIIKTNDSITKLLKMIERLKKKYENNNP